MILYAIFKEMKDKNLTIYQLVIHNQDWEIYTLSFKTLDEAVTEFFHQFEEVYKIYDLYNRWYDGIFVGNNAFWISRRITGTIYDLYVKLIETTIEL
jgi:hypothetical protein